MEQSVSAESVATKNDNCQKRKIKNTKKKKKSFTYKQKITLLLLGAAEFTSMSIVSLMAPFFPQEAASRGVSESISGTIFGYYAFVNVISAPIFGALMYKVGYKNLLLLGVVTTSVSSFILGAVGTIHDYNYFITWMFIIRGVEALGACAYATASFVCIWIIYPEDSAAVRGFLEIFVGLGLSAGPAFGGVLYTIGGFGLPFYIVGVVTILIVPPLYFLLPPSEKIIEQPSGDSVFKLLTISPVSVTCVLTIVVSMTWSFLEPTLAPHLKQFQLSPKNIGLLFLLLSATYGVSCPFFGWAANSKTKNWQLMIAGLFLNAVSLVFLSSTIILEFLPNTLWLDVLALLVFGVSVAMSLNPTYQAMTDGTTDGGFPDELNTHSLIAGLWFCVYSLGEVFGPILGGVLLENYGFSVTTTVFAFLNFVTAFIATAFYFVYKSENKINKKCKEIYKHKSFDFEK